MQLIKLLPITRFEIKWVHMNPPICTLLVNKTSQSGVLLHDDCQHLKCTRHFNDVAWTAQPTTQPRRFAVQVTWTVGLPLVHAVTFDTQLVKK